ncbi:MAG: energy transducer TonB [Pseudomonadota bacterium]
MSAVLAFDRPDPGRISSALLALAVHAVLFAVLVFGVRWQNRPPETVTAELWEAPQPAPVVEKPAPRVEPAAPPKPEPRIEKPDIAVKEPPKPKPAPKAEPKPKPVAKAEPLKPRVDETQKRVREELAREQAALAIERERAQIREQLAREAALSNARALAGWIDKIRAKIRGNIVLPPDLKGNPEAIFDVVQLPTGEVLSAKLRKSSGHAGYDAAVERAILKSSPLPRPDRPELFQRGLELRFHPRDPL